MSDEFEELCIVSTEVTRNNPLAIPLVTLSQSNVRGVDLLSENEIRIHYSKAVLGGDGTREVKSIEIRTDGSNKHVLKYLEQWNYMKN